MAVTRYDENELVRRLAPLRELPRYHGAMIFTHDLLLLSNQMPYSDARAVEIAQPILGMAQSMHISHREVKQLCFQARHFLLIYFPFRSGSLITRLAIEANADEAVKAVQPVLEALGNDLSAFVEEMLYEKPEDDEPVEPDLPYGVRPMEPPADIAARLHRPRN